MRKQDIRTGVVYAYQRSEFDTPEPCVLLGTELRTGRGRYDRTDAWSQASDAGDRPGKDYLGRHTGYVALFCSRPFSGRASARVAALMLAVTPDQYPAILETGVAPDGLCAEILTTLAPVRGVFEEVCRARSEKREQERRARKEADAERRAGWARAAALIARFDALGFALDTNYDGDQIAITADEAERIAELLERSADQ